MADTPSVPVHLLGALALELAPGAPARLALPPAEAGALAARIADDLAAFAPEAAQLELVIAGAHYDAVEVLRPGWPLHQRLAELAARAPGREGRAGRVVAFGAHDDVLPAGLAPAEDFVGGPLRLVPFLLRADDEADAARIGDRLERDLLEQGMAGAATALDAQARFGLRVEHARYLTLHDLAAMMALQYEHAELAPLWPLLEAALLAPTHEECLDAPPEPLVRYAQGEAHIALFSPDAWRARYAADADDGAQLERRFERFQARQRQFAAVLDAHGVPVTFDHCDRGDTI